MSKITPHPILPVPSRKSLELLAKREGINAVGEFLRKREEAIALSESDPLNYGFHLDPWKYAEDVLNNMVSVLALGGNRSGKTRWGSRTVVKAAIENPGAIIVCFAQDADASIRIQQSAVFNYLPKEFKQKQKGQVEYINYSEKNGFTGSSLILPNGSRIYFHTYSQFISNRKKFEGLELGSINPSWLNIGLWLDEYLDDGSLVDTMKFRLADRNSSMIITVTPIDGYTPFFGSYLKDARTEKTRAAKLLDGEQVPLVQICDNKDAGIVYFHSDLNPFGGYQRIKNELKNSSREEILTRAYGIPVKSITTLFPMFSTSSHVINNLPKITKDSHTIYQVVDPAGARNYVSIWAAVDKKGFVTVLKEWPDRDTYGPWCEMATGSTDKEVKWKYSDASKKIGYDVQGYVDLFREIEEDLGVEVFERIGDSRFFARENEDNHDLFDSFGDKGMYFVPSNGGEVDSGISGLDNWFSYNPNAPMDQANRPIVKIHNSCGNLIYSLLNWGNNGKKDEPLKDFVDLIRYLRMHNGGDGPDYVGGEYLQTTRKSKGGY